MSWEHFRHGADIGIRGRASTLAGAFAEAAVALTAVMVAPETVPAAVTREIELEAPDLEMLLYDWLNRLVYEMAVERMIFADYRVEIEAGGDTWRLRARVRGERLDRLRQRPAVEVKGATFTALQVRQQPGGGWLAQGVVDV